MLCCAMVVSAAGVLSWHHVAETPTGLQTHIASRALPLMEFQCYKWRRHGRVTHTADFQRPSKSPQMKKRFKSVVCTGLLHKDSSHHAHT